MHFAHIKTYLHAELTEYSSFLTLQRCWVVDHKGEGKTALYCRLQSEKHRLRFCCVSVFWLSNFNEVSLSPRVPCQGAVGTVTGPTYGTGLLEGLDAITYVGRMVNCYTKPM